MFQGTNFKEPKGSAKVERLIRRLALKATEDKSKAEVRRRDKRCRFPLCQCRKFGLQLHCAHSKHKGMGGNPKGERSAPELMVYVCSARHRENRMAIDRGTVRWRPLTEYGANGPIAWELEGEALQPFGSAVNLAGDVFVPHGWVEVARETAVGVLAPLADWQRKTLRALAAMRL
jgi:hypothetical protein